MPQFDLFGELVRDEPPEVKAGTTPSKSKVLPATPSSRAIEAAAKLSTRIHLGTSSWSCSGWDGLIYGGAYHVNKLAREGLNAYASHPLMRTVGIDRTFYAPISEREFAQYAAQVPDGFRFLVKAPMAITSSYVRANDGTFSDSPHFLDVEYAINEFVAPATTGLGTKCGPLVFQFPPQGQSHTRNVDQWINRLYRFLKELPPGFLNAVEIRDPELFTERFLKCLKATNVRLCIAGHASMPSPREQINKMHAVLDPGAFIARWSLHAGFKYADAKARYFPFNQLIDEDIDSRTTLAAACLEAIGGNHPAFIVVNNKAEGSAPLSIEKLAACVVGLPE
jgi:uncharacterized protein YecE (DUF72 family)